MVTSKLYTCMIKLSRFSHPTNTPVCFILKCNFRNLNFFCLQKLWNDLHKKVVFVYEYSCILECSEHTQTHTVTRICFNTLNLAQIQNLLNNRNGKLVNCCFKVKNCTKWSKIKPFDPLSVNYHLKALQPVVISQLKWDTCQRLVHKNTVSLKTNEGIWVSKHRSFCLAFISLAFRLVFFRISSMEDDTENETGTYAQTDEKFTCDWNVSTQYCHAWKICFLYLLSFLHH